MTTQDTNYTFTFSGKVLNFSKPVVMGILNVTPDSFFDGGRYLREKDWLGQTEKMLAEGASIIDIGACSTRPGSLDIGEEEELKRLLPVVKSVRTRFPGIVISIDTFRSATARKAIEIGGDLINDISGGNYDENMISTVSDLKTTYVLMHTQGAPATMQTNPIYADVVEDVSLFFVRQIKKLLESGVRQFILDPGFGFGKTMDHNFKLLHALPQFITLGYPLMAGLSRKSMINRVLDVKAAASLNGTSALNTIALLNGASLLRVHDVKEAMECIKLVEKYESVS